MQQQDTEVPFAEERKYFNKKEKSDITDQFPNYVYIDNVHQICHVCWKWQFKKDFKKIEKNVDINDQLAYGVFTQAMVIKMCFICQQW
jgi:hypothetical protein